MRREAEVRGLFGAVSFELFGQRNNVFDVTRRDAFFAEETRRIARLLALE